MSAKAPLGNSGRYVSRLTSGTLAIIMAGGRGERLKQLTNSRAKPATPFGGKFRIVDFVLSNCVNSGIRQIAVLTQYKAQSLIEHVQRGWGYLRGEFGEFVTVIPAQQQVGPHWYQGTADAVYQNLEYIRSHHPKHVLVLAGDHIYTMDYGPMIAAHVEKNADISIGVVEVPVALAREYGVLSVSESNRVMRFAEKPANPETIPGRPDTALASMGIYIFNADLLDRLLTEDAARGDSQHDFGKNIIPASLSHLRVYAYAFQDVRTRAQAYWRDVGTLDAYYEANMELVYVRPELNIYDEEWPIWTYQLQRPPAKFILDDHAGRRGHLGEHVQRKAADALPDQGAEDQHEPAQAEGRRGIGQRRPDEIAALAAGVERVGHQRPAFVSSRASIRRASARTMKVMMNRMKPSASSEAVNRPGSASANWLAIIAEMVVP